MRRLLPTLLALLVVLPPASANAIVVRDGTIYWIREAKASDHSGRTAGIGSINVDGTGLKRLLVRGVVADDLAVDGSLLYWSGPPPGKRSHKRVIGRAGTDGHGIKRTLVRADAEAIAAYDGSLYWLTGKTVGRARSNGRGANARFLAIKQPGWVASGLAVGAAGIFWGQGVAHGKAWDRAREGGPVGRIGHAELSGAGVDPAFASWRAAVLISSSPRIVGLDGPSLYWLTANPDNALQHLAAEADDIGYCQPVFSNCDALMRLADEAVNPNSRFAVDNGVLYWATPVSGGTRIYRAPITREMHEGAPGASETLEAREQVAFVRDTIR
ncbi:MAG TPA: hypothetical protein VNS09_19820 [Solirubrobacter sp.]|nr:hypothetical protein [Solirubrobacter sp.]